MPEIDLVWFALSNIVTLIGGSGGVLVYLRRHIDLHYHERIADLEDRKSDNETFASVVRAFELSIQTHGKSAEERTRVQAEIAADNRKYMKENIEVLTHLQNGFEQLGRATSQMEASIVTEQSRQHDVLSKLLNEHKALRAGVDKVLTSADDLKTSVLEALGLDTLERTKILNLLEKLVSQIQITGSDAVEAEVVHDPSVSGEVGTSPEGGSQGSQK